MFIAVTTPVSINRMIAWSDGKPLIRTYTHFFNIYIYTHRYVYIKSMFLSQLPLHDSKSGMLGDGELAKSDQRKICDFQGALRIIFLPSPFRTPTCLSQKNLDFPTQCPAVLYSTVCQKLLCYCHAFPGRSSEKHAYVHLYIYICVNGCIRVDTDTQSLTC